MADRGVATETALTLRHVLLPELVAARVEELAPHALARLAGRDHASIAEAEVVVARLELAMVAVPTALTVAVVRTHLLQIPSSVRGCLYFVTPRVVADRVS